VKEAVKILIKYIFSNIFLIIIFWSVESDKCIRHKKKEDSELGKNLKILFCSPNVPKFRTVFQGSAFIKIKSQLKKNKTCHIRFHVGGIKSPIIHLTILKRFIGVPHLATFVCDFHFLHRLHPSNIHCQCSNPEHFGHELFALTTRP
jgi:hypothetical protein